MDNSPWWKSGIFAAILGSMIPLATAIQGHLQNGRELEAQRSQQFQELKLAYMSFLKQEGLEGLERVASFAAAAERDPDIRKWAENIKLEAASAIARERTQLTESEAAVTEAAAARRLAEQQADDALAHAQKLELQAAADRDAKQRAEQAARKAKDDAAKAVEARSAHDAAKERASRSKQTLVGRPISSATPLDAARPLEQSQVQQVRYVPLEALRPSSPSLEALLSTTNPTR